MSTSQQQAPEAPQGRPGRYQRTTSGLIGAMIVSLLAIAAFVVFRAVNREELEVRPEPVDYLASVEAIQKTGVRVIYPPDLPADWVCTSASYRRGEEPAAPEWDLGMLTADGRFAGVRQSSESAEDLVTTYVDEEATPGGPVRLDSPLGRTWQTFTDSGGDHAFATRWRGQTVLVYGSARDSELTALAESLVAAPR